MIFVSIIFCESFGSVDDSEKTVILVEDDTHATDELPIAPNLEQVQQLFESWRQPRNKRTRIPQNLWEAAVTLSEEYSIYHLSKALRVNHSALKKRVSSSHTPESGPCDVSPFVELPARAVPFLDATIEIDKKRRFGHENACKKRWLVRFVRVGKNVFND